MNYQSFLIANFATGLDRELQPWLLPNDAFVELLDGYAYRGVIAKRDGYSGFANGIKSVPTESRMVHNIPAFATAQTNTGAALTPITLTSLPVSRGGVTVTDTVESHTDNGLGSFTTAAAGTINYTTGVITGFQFNAASGNAVTVDYDYYPGLPVMGVFSFYPTNNTRQLVVADTTYVNRYDPVTDRLEDISSATAYTGTSSDFWSWVNYADPVSVPRLLFCNGVVGDVIQQYNGTTVSAYAPTFSGGTLNARQIFNARDRLILFQTIEAGVLKPRRIRISGTGANSDNFNNTATGAGFIDIPDNTWFFGAAFNRDDILFFTEAATWMLKYTGNDVTPFILEKIDGSRGCAAAFSVISYLNRTLAASPRGLIISDGYQVERADTNIPDFTFEDIDGNNFNKCFSGFFDEDRDVYTLYPSKGDIKPPLVPSGGSDRILVTNFEEDNFSVYRLPLSCVGNFQTAFTLLWSDLTAVNGFPNWDAFSIKIGSWNAFPYTKDVPIAIGGGHKGEIWKLNDAESEDNPQPIRAITALNNLSIQVTTDWNNYEVGDYIVFEEVGGMEEINDKQGQITSIDTNYNIFTVSFGQDHGGFSAYTSGGQASRVIPLEAIGKKLNPYVEADKKVRCGWMYFYVSTTATDLTDWDEDATPVIAQLRVDVITNNNNPPDFSRPQFTYLVNCTNASNQKGDKKWVKIWINQVGEFLQFKLSNVQAGAQIRLHAMMCGFQPVGELI